MSSIDSSWLPVVEAWTASPAGQRMLAHVEQRKAQGALVYPPEPFRALRLTPLSMTRVVILGQDPYHGPGQAEGLAFSVPAGQKVPPSLRNIYKELQRDLGQQPPMSGSLEPWARRGVLLLNTCLTVEDGAAASHAKFEKTGGWESLTDALITAAAAHPKPKVFMLWGAHAQAKSALIEAAGPQHLVLQANHPSPLSATRPPAPFIGCSHFSTAARWLAERGEPVNWDL